jgi:ribosomal protein L13
LQLTPEPHDSRLLVFSDPSEEGLAVFKTFEDMLLDGVRNMLQRAELGLEHLYKLNIWKI